MLFGIFYIFLWNIYQLFLSNIDKIGRQISIIHCYLILGLMGYNHILNKPLETFLLVNSVTYWSVDILMNTMLSEGLDKNMMFHHVLAIVTACVSRPKLLPYALVSEISTIFLNKTWFLHLEKKTHLKKFVYYCRSLLFSFFLFRIINFTVILFYFFDKNEYDSYLFIPIWILNIFWFHMLIKMGLKYNVYF